MYIRAFTRNIMPANFANSFSWKRHRRTDISFSKPTTVCLICILYHKLTLALKRNRWSSRQKNYLRAVSAIFLSSAHVYLRFHRATVHASWNPCSIGNKWVQFREMIAYVSKPREIEWYSPDSTQALHVPACTRKRVIHRIRRTGHAL